MRRKTRISLIALALVLAGCASASPRLISVEACYHAILTEADAAVLRERGWALAKAGDLIISRACADADIARLADEIRALAHPLSGTP